jgi:hypothetical protein
MSTIEAYLRSCHELSRFCSRNGWIDNSSLRYTIVWQNENEVHVNIEFDEMLMEGAGCLAERVCCCGQMRLLLDRFGRVLRSDIL